MSFKNTSLIVLISLVFIQRSHGQTYLGAGYAEAYLTESAADDVTGVAIRVERSVPLPETERLKFVPTLQISLLNSRLDQKSSAAYSTTLSLAPLVYYEVVRGLSG